MILSLFHFYSTFIAYGSSCLVLPLPLLQSLPLRSFFSARSCWRSSPCDGSWRILQRRLPPPVFFCPFVERTHFFEAGRIQLIRYETTSNKVKGYRRLLATCTIRYQFRPIPTSHNDQKCHKNNQFSSYPFSTGAMPVQSLISFMSEIHVCSWVYRKHREHAPAITL